MQKSEARPLPMSYTEINLKWIKDLNLPNAIKLLEGNIGETLQDIAIDKDFLQKTPAAKAIKAKVNKRDYTNLSFCAAKETFNKVKMQPTERKKIFVNYTSDIYKSSRHQRTTK